MKEDHIISIIGKQFYEDDNTEVNINTLGSYTIKDGVRYIMYRDYESGEPKPKSSMLRIDDNSVVLTNPGTSTKLILEKGKRHGCIYDLGFGSLNMGVFTNEIDSKLDDDGGTIRLSYTLDINSVNSSRNELFVQVQSVKKGLK